MLLRKRGSHFLQFQEGVDSSDISQYPLEDILDKYCCYISDFYEEPVH